MENLEKKSVLLYLYEIRFLVLIIFIPSYLNVVIASQFYVVFPIKASMLMIILAKAISLCMAWAVLFSYAFLRWEHAIFEVDLFV